MVFVRSHFVASNCRQAECMEFSEHELARPASTISIETLKRIGSRLSLSKQNNDWCIVAEKLGYDREAIDHFLVQADASRTCVGFQILYEWSLMTNGASLFVLRDVLKECDRPDCVHILDESIKEGQTVALYVRIDDKSNPHSPALLKVKVRGSGTLRESLLGVIGDDVDEFTILQEGLSWDRTLARDMKGRQLMLKRETKHASFCWRRRRDSKNKCVTKNTSTDANHPSHPHCNTCTCQDEKPEQSNLISSSSSSSTCGNIESQTFTKTLNIEVQNPEIVSTAACSSCGIADNQTSSKILNIPVQKAETVPKKRKLEAPNFSTLGLDEADDTSVDENMDISLDTLNFSDTTVCRPNLKTGVQAQGETSFITNTGYEPLRPRSKDIRKTQFDSFLSHFRWIRHSHRPKLDRTRSFNTTLLPDTLADIINVAHTPRPSALPEVPPRLRFRECEVLRDKEENVQNDETFNYFCKHLKKFPGWCPKENETTIESTLRIVCEDGNYIIWYFRKRKHLTMSISHLKSFLHYRIHTRVTQSELVYHFYPEHSFPGLSQLVEYHKVNGMESKHEASSLNPNPESLNRNRNRKPGSHGAIYCHVHPKCPVRVTYHTKKRYSV